MTTSGNAMKESPRTLASVRGYLTTATSHISQHQPVCGAQTILDTSSVFNILIKKGNVWLALWHPQTQHTDRAGCNGVLLLIKGHLEACLTASSHGDCCNKMSGRSMVS